MIDNIDAFSFDKHFASKISIEKIISQIVAKQKKISTHHNMQLNCMELIGNTNLVVGSADGTIS